MSGKRKKLQKKKQQEEEERKEHKCQKKEEEERQNQLQWEQFEKMLTNMPSEKVQRLFNTLTGKKGQSNASEATAKENKPSASVEEYLEVTTSKITAAESSMKLGKTEEEEGSETGTEANEITVKAKENAVMAEDQYPEKTASALETHEDSPFDFAKVLVIEEFDTSIDITHSKELLETDIQGW